MSIAGGIQREEQCYRDRTPTSARLFVDAVRVLPGGDTRSTLHHHPYPLQLTRGAGTRVWDVDDNEYVDFTNNHTALVHGNAYAPVLNAVREQLESGTCFGTPTPLQIDAARCLVDRVASLERVRFCASGTEATMHATRVSRATTGRRLIAKAEGAYHGSQDDVFVSTHPTPENAGPPERPNAVPRSEGLGRSALTDTIVIPFNDAAAATERLCEIGDDLAGVLVEPVMGSAGMIPAEPEYLRALRDVTRKSGSLLVFDEVITLRLAHGGAQEWFDVAPDLTCFGKMIGGGFPLGAFGGRADVMDRFDPAGDDALAHPGSMNAYPVALVAAMTTLADLTRTRIDRMNDLGAQLRGRLEAVATSHAVPLQVTGLGSLLALHYRSAPVHSFRDTWDEDRERQQGVFLGLLNEGVLIDRRGAACLSTQTGQAEVDAFVSAFDRVLHRF